MLLLAQWLITSLTILAVPYLVPGVSVDSFGAALAAAALLGIFNVLVKPILFVLTLPITLLTLGIFYLVLNALMFYWVSLLVGGVHVESFGSAFLAGLCVSFVSWVFNVSFKRENGSRMIVVRQFGTGGSNKTRDLN